MSLGHIFTLRHTLDTHLEASALATWKTVQIDWLKTWFYPTSRVEPSGPLALAFQCSPKEELKLRRQNASDLWNSLSEDLRAAQNTNVFKSKLSNCLIQTLSLTDLSFKCCHFFFNVLLIFFTLSILSNFIFPMFYLHYHFNTTVSLTSS